MRRWLSFGASPAADQVLNLQADLEVFALEILKPALELITVPKIKDVGQQNPPEAILAGKDRASGAETKQGRSSPKERRSEGDEERGKVAGANLYRR